MKTLIVWMIAVLSASMMPADFEAAKKISDYIPHFVMYFIMCALAHRAFIKKYPRNKTLLLSVGISSGYGLLMEVLQGFTWWRSFSMTDALFNTIGALCAAVFILIIGRRRHEA